MNLFFIPGLRSGYCLGAIICAWLCVITLTASARDFTDPGPGIGRTDIRIQFVDELNFGRVAASRHPGHIHLHAPSGIVNTSGVTQLSGHQAIGRLILRGQPNAEFQIFLPETIQFTGPDSALTAKDLHAHPEQIGRFDPQGYAEISIGGMLEIPPSAAGGNYTSQFSISAEYL